MDALIQLMSAMHTNIFDIKKKVTGLENELADVKSQGIETDKKVTQLIRHAAKTDKSIEFLTESVNILDKRSERIEKQTLPIGIELKEENKTLDTRVANLEKEFFPQVAH